MDNCEKTLLLEVVMLLSSQQAPVVAKAASQVALWEFLAELETNRVEQSESQAKKESKVG